VRRKLHGRIVSSTQRMGQLITDLLDFTRVRMGRGLPIQYTPTDINGICRTVCEELELAHPGRRIELLLDALGPGMWDRARLVQAISNIVGNALQYSPMDSSVTVRTHDAYASGGTPHEEGLFVEVHNWGDPIPEDLMARLFEPFHSSTQSQSSSGLGLGLFIAERIISGHRGQVRVHSSSEDGVRFTIYLPRDPQRVGQRDGMWVG
jgi:sigma-B regulation protein RsbU (phosphoserine phosphatase)